MPRKPISRTQSNDGGIVPATTQELVRTGAGSQPPAVYARMPIGAVRQPEPVVTNFPEMPAVLETEVSVDADSAADDATAALQAIAPGGCYLARYTPNEAFGRTAVHYDGTLRVERAGTRVLASGDLYVHRFARWPGAPVPREPNPAGGIPVFARSNYTYFLRVTRFSERSLLTGRSVLLGIDFFRFTSGSWSAPAAHSAVLKSTAPPLGFPATSPYFTGEVRNASGAVVGQLSLFWVSKYFRRATVEIDRCAPCEWPLNNGAGIDWKAVLGLAGWDINILQDNSDVAEPSGASWSNAEMHAAMLARRNAAANLDNEWRYHVLCVRNIDATPRGIMYDNGATDSNNVPREGIGIASHWDIPDEPLWGLVRGQRFGTAAGPYFRTAVHEIGHAMGLYHNTIDLGIMNTTDVIAAAASGQPVPFPNNIQWAHAPDDQARLRHLPDIHVRPGGTPFGTPYGPDENAEVAEGLRVEVTPVLQSFPIGAPVRVDFAPVNDSGVPLPVPRSLNMKNGHVRGVVVDPSGGTQPFLPMLLCVEEHELQLLEPGDRIGHSLTLLRGPRGSLFAAPGAYRIAVDISWDVDGVPVTQRGETSVMITPAQTESHANAALKVLSTPDTVVALVVGGDHLTAGLEAIQAALGDEILRPHFAPVEAKRLATPFLSRPADVDRAASLMQEGAVYTQDEEKKLTRLGVTM